MITSSSVATTLLNTAGDPTAVTLGYTTGGLFNNPPSESGFAGTSYQNLMSSYLYVTSASNPPVNFTLAGLTPNADYVLYFYSQANYFAGNSSLSGDGREITIEINGSSYTIAQEDSSLSSFVEGQNYLQISAVSDANGDLAFNLSSPASGVGQYDQNLEADLNGFQFVAVPEPASAGVVLCGFAALLLNRCRHRLCKRSVLSDAQNPK